MHSELLGWITNAFDPGKTANAAAAYIISLVHLVILLLCFARHK